MDKIFFVTLNVYNAVNEDYSLKSMIIRDAETPEEAIGHAVSQTTINSMNMMTNYSIQMFEPEATKARDYEHALNLSLETFFHLLEISETTIMDIIHTLLLEGDPKMKLKIPAIKALRNFMKPHIGLKGCKDIVDLWVSEIQDGMPKSSLVTLTKRLLRIGDYETYKAPRDFN